MPCYAWAVKVRFVERLPFVCAEIYVLAYRKIPGEKRNREASLINRQKGVSMKVTIDYDLCMGDRQCSEMCPEIFEYDEEKIEARVRVDVVPPELEDRVRQTAAKCDTGAITIKE